MNVNVLVPTAVLSTPSHLQQPQSDFQPSVNIVPVNTITQVPEVVPLIDSSYGHETQQQITPDENRPASLLNQEQVNRSLVEKQIHLS